PTLNLFPYTTLFRSQARRSPFRSGATILGEKACLSFVVSFRTSERSRHLGHGGVAFTSKVMLFSNAWTLAMSGRGTPFALPKCKDRKSTRLNSSHQI